MSNRRDFFRTLTGLAIPAPAAALASPPCHTNVDLLKHRIGVLEFSIAVGLDYVRGPAGECVKKAVFKNLEFRWQQVKELVFKDPETDPLIHARNT